MTLQSSGAISMNDINVELGRSGTATIGLNQAESGSYGAINTASASRPNGSTPNSMNEWYGYNHTAAPCYSFSTTQVYDGLNSCFVGSYGTTKYSGCSSLSNGCTMYTNSSCTSIDYQPATYTYQTSDGLNFEINFLGQVGSTASTPC